MGSDCMGTKRYEPQVTELPLTKKNIYPHSSKIQMNQLLQAKKEQMKKQSLKDKQIRLSTTDKQSSIFIKSDIQANILQAPGSNKYCKMQQININRSTKDICSPKIDLNLFKIQEDSQIQIQEPINLKKINSSKVSQLQKTNKSKIGQQNIQINVGDEEEDMQNNKNGIPQYEDDDDIFKAAGVGVSSDSRVVKWSGINKTDFPTRKQNKSGDDFLRGSQLQVKKQDFQQEEGNEQLAQGQQLQGTIIEQEHFSTIKVYNSKIMFQAVLPKSQAGPIIVPYIGYSQYCI